MVIVEKVLLPEIKKTDDKLIALARQKKAQLYTTDFNLGKVATISDVRVLNVNKLSGALRPIFLPGEQMMVKILQKGSNANQGVGYTEDGTMLVVENGSKFLGQVVKVSVKRMLQSAAGKMAFAEIVASKQSATGSKTASRAQLASKTKRSRVLPKSRHL